MRYLSKTLVAVTAVLALAGITATAASADEWLANKLPLSEPVAAESNNAELTFITNEIGRLTCDANFAGTVGVRAKSVWTSITNAAGEKAITCNKVGTAGCESGKEIKVEAIGLPWSSKLQNTSSGIVNVLESSGAKWKFKCTILGSKLEDSCKATPGRAAKNSKPLGTVYLTSAGPEETSCELGSLEATEGLQIVSSPIGLDLEVLNL